MKLRLTNLAVAILALSFMFLLSCGEATEVGSGLLNDEDINIEFRDDLDFSVKSVITQPTITFTSLNNPINSHLVGELNDPVFGYTSASIYFQMRYFNTILPDYSESTVDSAVLMIEIDTSVVYGNDSDKIDFEVYRLIDNILNIDTIRSDDVFQIGETPIGRLEGYAPGAQDSFTFYDPIVRDTLTVTNAIRIPIDMDFAEELHSLPIPTDGAADDLLENFSGFYLRGLVDGSVVMSFDLSGNSTNSIFSLFYTPNDTTSTRFNYLLGFDRPIQYRHDYLDTEIINRLNVDVGPEDVIYLQGMNGPDAEIDLSSLTSLPEDILLNHVELEFFIASTELVDTVNYPAARSIGLYKKNADGDLVQIEDLRIAQTTGATNILFGGNRTQSGEFTGLESYKMNLTTHVKDILDGDEPTTLYLSILDKADNPERTILYGPKDANYPAKIRVTYTKL